MLWAVVIPEIATWTATIRGLPQFRVAQCKLTFSLAENAGSAEQRAPIVLQTEHTR